MVLVRILIKNLLDASVTSGFLPYALRAMLRMFKIVPDDFVAGMTLILATIVMSIFSATLCNYLVNIFNALSLLLVGQ